MIENKSGYILQEFGNKISCVVSWRTTQLTTQLCRSMVLFDIACSLGSQILINDVFVSRRSVKNKYYDCFDSTSLCHHIRQLYCVWSYCAGSQPQHGWAQLLVFEDTVLGKLAFSPECTITNMVLGIYFVCLFYIIWGYCAVSLWKVAVQAHWLRTTELNCWSLKVLFS